MGVFVLELHMNYGLSDDTQIWYPDLVPISTLYVVALLKQNLKIFSPSFTPTGQLCSVYIRKRHTHCRQLSVGTLH